MTRTEYLKFQSLILEYRNDKAYLQKVIDHCADYETMISKSIEVYLDKIDFNPDADTNERKAYRYLCEQFDQVTQLGRIAKAYYAQNR